MDWGGAQWFLLFLVAFRALTGLLIAGGVLTVTRAPPSKLSDYISNRFVDAIFVLIIWWGGFW